MKDEKIRVAIVGAGLVGTTLSYYLRRRFFAYPEHLDTASG